MSKRNNPQPRTLEAALAVLQADKQIIQELQEQLRTKSDGHHTFEELYEHRNLLFISWITSTDLGVTYFVGEHYPGWDLVVTHVNNKQISYHVPAYMRRFYEEHIPERTEEQHKYDGHLADDTLKRIREWLGDE